mgnify:CR=1 FL=1
MESADWNVDQDQKELLRVERARCMGKPAPLADDDSEYEGYSMVLGIVTIGVCVALSTQFACGKSCGALATRGGAVSIEHVREWLLVALARDSSTLFARASLMASQGKLKLSGALTHSLLQAAQLHAQLLNLK